MASNLLKQWCDGMLALVIDDPADLARHGALACPSCDFIHGRCMDAVYPFFHMASATGDMRYRDAGIKVFEWSRNVSQPDGSWTVMPDPTSWKGITIFGAIALAETLHLHGDLLEAGTRDRWTERLGLAGEFVHENFSMPYSNINYGATAIHGLNLLGRVLDRPEYLEHARKLAGEFKDYLTAPNKLLWGEGKPFERMSPRGLHPVDLGYNVEESLNNVVQYALHERDEELLELVIASMRGHLEFMLPDGAWDNSWGTRQAKWSYWGSRTADGCQPGFGFLAKRVPEFGTAAWMSTDLLRRCTHDGLLYGGLHLKSRGLKPCVHHTFAHAKALATVLDAGDRAAAIRRAAALPRSRPYGIRTFPEIATWLVSVGPWRGTVTAYDWTYRPKVRQATGGSLSALWHDKVGPLFMASMAEYMMVEEYNQQLHIDDDVMPLTPRLESNIDGAWFTNLHDLEARVTPSGDASEAKLAVSTSLRDNEQAVPESGEIRCGILYRFTPEKLVITARRDAAGPPVQLVLPLISEAREPFRRISDRCIEIDKPGGTVRILANAPLRLAPTDNPVARVFNLVPGFEALPLNATLPDVASGELEVGISVV